MPDKQLEWYKPGTCPSCGVLTEHIWFLNLLGTRVGEDSDSYGNPIEHPMEGSQGRLLASKCVSAHCQVLALWLDSDDKLRPSGHGPRLVYPQMGIRHPPEEGLEPQEIKLYEEAASVAPASPRAACALVRVLLEALLKRNLVAAGHPIQGDKGWDKPLVDLIDMAVKELPLSASLMDGLTAIRNRGNSAVHDPYGLTDEARAEELPLLFQAVDDLVDDLHTKPKRWAGMAQP